MKIPGSASQLSDVSGPRSTDQSDYIMQLPSIQDDHHSSSALWVSMNAVHLFPLAILLDARPMADSIYCYSSGCKHPLQIAALRHSWFRPTTKMQSTDLQASFTQVKDRNAIINPAVFSRNIKGKCSARLRMPSANSPSMRPAYGRQRPLVCGLAG